MPHGDLRRPRRLWGAAICETVATCVGSWEVQRRDVLRGSEEASPSLGGCDLRNYGNLRGLPVGRNAFAAFSAGRCSVIARMALFFIVTIARGAATPTGHLQFSLLRMFLHPLVVAFLPMI